VDNTAIQQQYTIETSQQASEAMKKSACTTMYAPAAEHSSTRARGANAKKGSK